MHVQYHLPGSFSSSTDVTVIPYFLLALARLVATSFLCILACEILPGARLKENRDNYREKEGMDSDLPNHGKADHYVERYPSYREPARPIAPQEHEHTRNQCEQFRRFNPQILVVKR